MKPKIPFLSTSPQEDIGLAISLIWLWWMLGVNIVVFQAVALIVLAKMMVIKRKTGCKIIIPYCLLPLIGLAATYAFSLAVNASGFSAGRVMAGVNNLSVWIVGIIVIAFIYNFFEEAHITAVAKALFILGRITIVFSISAILLWILFKREIVVFSPVYYLVPGSLKEEFDLLKQSTELVFVGTDWFSLKSIPRIAAFFPYPVALGGAMLMTIPVSTFVIRNKGKLHRWLNFTLLQIPLLLSISRLSILAFWGVNGVAGLLRRKRVLLLSVLLIAVPLVVINIGSMLGAYDYILKLREASSLNRFSLYGDTISLALKSPVIGWGIKPTHDTLLIRIGSHSTYIGLLYKTGMLGLLFYTVFLVSVGVKCMRNAKGCGAGTLSGCLAVAFFSMVLWQLGEDIDAPQNVAFIYFVVVGMILRIERGKTVAEVPCVK